MLEIKQKPHLHASWIDPDAQEIVRVLQRAGFKSYLVGGCVRDLLAGIHPKDFDIATDAEPNQVKRKVWGSYVIGRRFRLVLVKRGDQQYEVATFRREITAEELKTAELEKLEQNGESENEGPVSVDNFFGTPEQDALRRDFTINGLFYDPIKDELIDYCHGLPDIKSCTLRMIGDPTTRILEDPIRSLRAIRLSHKLKFIVESELLNCIQKNADALKKSVLPRRREEYLKFLRLDDPALAFLQLFDLGIIDQILPSLAPVFQDPDRQELFLHYLHDLKEISPDLSLPGDVFATFIFAYMKAMEGHPDAESKLKSLMRDEIMLFKSEHAYIFSALELIDTLQNIEAFKRRGHRRQTAFLKHESFMLALRISRYERLLSGEQLFFWKNLIQPN